MLTSTYTHIPGIGKTIEKRIWESGYCTWDEYLEHQDEISIPATRKEKIENGIAESKKHLEKKDFEYFANCLPSAEQWRAFEHFSDSVAYVDIETTGLSPSSSYITVIGIYDGEDAKTYVKGIDLEDVVEELQKYELLVSFNGARFDLPFIQKEFPQIEFNQLHIDLMYPLRRIGLSGGLKAIEKKLEITRTDETVGITGFDAVRLWHEYERGNEGSLELLLEYNREDIVNLKTIIEKTYLQFIERTFQKTLGK
ncbi:MAG: ribonuclease H-like domain-containing protein [Methanococcoides sp.]|nr:ribonuclease H-like domain-containing protein [Methanococcoides sp.]